MSKQPHRTRPGEFEIRIRPDGRLSIFAPDEALMDLAEAVAPDHPAVVLRRKARNRADTRDAKKRARSS